MMDGYFSSFDGWKNLGRKGKSLFVAEFTRASDGQRCRYGERALRNLESHPPRHFSSSDYQLVDHARTHKPGPR